MSFSKAVLLVVFAILLISAEVSAHRDLAETTTARSTYVRREDPRNIGGKPPKCKNIYKRGCERYNRGSNGGRGAYNRGKGGRGGHGPETEN